MPCKFTNFRNLQHRIRRTMHYGRDDLNTLTEPLSRMVVDYFESNFSSYDPPDMEFLATFSAHRCVNPCTLLVAMIYVNRMRLAEDSRRSHDEGVTASGSGDLLKRPSSELFLSAMILASKYLNDGGLNEFIWNDEFATASKFDVAKINRLELEMLDELNWELLVDEKTFDSAVDAAEQWIAAETLRRNGFLTYNEINIFATNPILYLPHAEQFLATFMTILATYAATVTLLFCTVALPLTITSTGRGNDNHTTPSTSTYHKNVWESSTTVHSYDYPTKSIDCDAAVSDLETESSEANERRASEIANRQQYKDWFPSMPPLSLDWNSLQNESSSTGLMDWLLISRGSSRQNIFSLANIGALMELRVC